MSEASNELLLGEDAGVDSHRCLECDGIYPHKLTWAVMSDGRRMLKGECLECGKVRAMPQNNPAQDFVMPYGKHKGLALKDIPRDYLYWVKANSDKSVLKKVTEFLAEADSKH